MRKNLTSTFLMFFIFAVSAFAQTTSTTFSVSPANPSGWYAFDDSLPTNASSSQAMFVDGPATPPMGSGSVVYNTITGNDRPYMATNTYFGTRIADITKFGYSTYQTGPTLAIALKFDVKYRTTDTSYGGRLVFEPYQQTGTVGAGWQTWNPYNGVWWASKTSAAGSGGLCPQSAPCPWSTIVATFPNATMSGRLLLGAGGGWVNFTGNMDAFVIGVNDGSGEQVDTYDFNLHSTPTDKDQCKNGGYKNFNPPTGPYKNQGQCVSDSNHQ